MDVDGWTGATVVRLRPDAGGCLDGSFAEAVARARRLLASGHDVIVALEPSRTARVAALDAVARLALAARRSGAQLTVLTADTALRQMAELMGLADVLGLRGESCAPPADPAHGADPD